MPDQSSYDKVSAATRVILALNLILVVAKMGAGWLGGSFALLADGINSLSDVGVSGVLFVALYIASRPPDRHHRYGHGRMEQEASRLIATAVLVTGGGIIWEAVKRLPEAQSLPDTYVLVVAAVSIAVKAGMYVYQNRKAIELGSSALAADALNHKADIGATSCVFVGTAAVYLGGPAWAPADDVAAIVVGLLMVAAAGHTILDTTSELLDRQPPEHFVGPIRELAASFPGVTGVDRVLGRKLGMQYFIDMHLEVPPDMPVSEAHLLGHNVKDLLMAELPEIGDITIHLEPTPRPPVVAGGVDPSPHGKT